VQIAQTPDVFLHGYAAREIVPKRMTLEITPYTAMATSAILSMPHYHG
jgi:hypothetical protein